VSGERRKAYGADLVIPVLAAAFTIYVLSTIASLEWEAKANGIFVGVALLVLVAVQVIRAAIGIARKHGDLSFAPLLGPREALPKRLGMLAITIAFVCAVPWLGLGLGLFASLAAGFAIMGVRPYRRVLLTAFIVAAVCTVMFNAVLDTGLPKGPVERLIERASG
jgi:hypothetical protein